MSGMSPVGHPWLGGLFDDPEVAAILSPESEVARMLAVEAAHAEVLGTIGRVEAPLAAEAAGRITAHRPDMAALRAGTARDGVVIPALVAGLRADLGTDLTVAVHAPMTSQDVIDTAMAMATAEVLDLFAVRLAGLDRALSDLTAREGPHPLMARTRMQAALPATVADRLRNWQAPLTRHAARLAGLRDEIALLQLGGPVGDRRGWGTDAPAVAQAMAARLGLSAPADAWHVQRDRQAVLAGALAALAGSLGKIGQDVALMAQQSPPEVRLSGGGGSSAMAHKSNPVLAELLVALARQAAGLCGAMQQAALHEQERSGAGWMLEWLTLPDLLTCTGRSLTAAAALIASVERLGPDH